MRGDRQYFVNNWVVRQSSMSNCSDRDISLGWVLWTERADYLRLNMVFLNSISNYFIVFISVVHIPTGKIEIFFYQSYQSLSNGTFPPFAQVNQTPFIQMLGSDTLRTPGHPFKILGVAPRIILSNGRAPTAPRWYGNRHGFPWNKWRL